MPQSVLIFNDINVNNLTANNNITTKTNLIADGNIEL